MLRVVKLDAISSSLRGNWSAGDRVLVLCDATLAAFSVTLPDAKSSDDVTFKIIKTDTTSNAITVNTVESQTISGETFQTVTMRGDAMSLDSDGDNWWIT